MADLRSKILRRGGTVEPEGYQENHSRKLEIVTFKNPPKGWSWTLYYEGEAVARCKHHHVTEYSALKAANRSMSQHLSERFRADADPEEIIRTDRWEEQARKRAAQYTKEQVAKNRKPNRVRVKLECGHIRAVRPLGKDRLRQLKVYCPACDAHDVLVTEKLDSY